LGSSEADLSLDLVQQLLRLLPLAGVMICCSDLHTVRRDRGVFLLHNDFYQGHLGLEYHGKYVFALSNYPYPLLTPYHVVFLLHCQEHFLVLSEFSIVHQVA
jgi:hypothetical protein